MKLPLDRRYEMELTASPERVSQVRRIVAAHLRHWNLELHIESVCAGIEELLTNVHRHVGDGNTCVLELRWTGRYLTAAVADHGPRMPRLVTAHGGGLRRIAAQSDSWGTCATAEGKVVWFTKSVEAPQNIRRVLRTPLGLLGAAQKQPPPVPGTGPLIEPAPILEPPPPPVPAPAPILEPEPPTGSSPAPALA